MKYHTREVGLFICIIKLLKERKTTLQLKRHFLRSLITNETEKRKTTLLDSYQYESHSLAYIVHILVLHLTFHVKLLVLFMKTQTRVKSTT